MKYISLLLISLSLISCEPTAEVAPDNVVSFELPDVGTVIRYRVNTEYGPHYIYVIKGKISVTVQQKQGKVLVPITLITNDGPQYELVPKVEK